MADKRPVLFLPKAHLQAIGNLAAHWAYLEWVTEYAIWAALGINANQGSAITTHVGMVSRCQMILILIHQQFPAGHCKPMEWLLGRIDKARVQRNDIIHFIWMHSRSGAAMSAIKITAKGKLKIDKREMTAGQIRAVTSEVFDLVSEMMGLLEDMYPTFEFPWREKSIPQDRKLGAANHSNPQMPTPGQPHSPPRSSRG